MDMTIMQYAIINIFIGLIFAIIYLPKKTMTFRLPKDPTRTQYTMQFNTLPYNLKVLLYVFTINLWTVVVLFEVYDLVFTKKGNK